MMTLKAVKDITGMVINPKYPVYFVAQDAPRTHGAIASDRIPFCKSTWYKAINQPTMLIGNA